MSDCSGLGWLMSAYLAAFTSTGCTSEDTLSTPFLCSSDSLGPSWALLGLRVLRMICSTEIFIFIYFPPQCTTINDRKDHLLSCSVDFHWFTWTVIWQLLEKPVGQLNFALNIGKQRTVNQACWFWFGTSWHVGQR